MQVIAPSDYTASIVSAMEAQLATAADVREQVAVKIELAWALRYQDARRCYDLSTEAKEQAQTIHFTEGLAACLRNIGFYHYFTASHEVALKTLHSALQLYSRQRDRLGEATVMQVYPFIYLQLGDFEEAVNYATKAYQIFESYGSEQGQAWALLAMGQTNLEMNNVDAAMKNNEVALSLFDAIGDVFGKANALCGLGCVHRARGSVGRALEHHTESISLFRQLTNPWGVARCQYEFGLTYHSLDNADESLQNFFECSKVFEEINHRYYLLCSLLETGNLFLEQRLLDEAFVSLFRAEGLASDIKAKPKQSLSHRYLSQAFAISGNFEKAWEHHRLFHTLHEQVNTFEARARLLNQQISLITEKSRTEAELLRSKNNELTVVNKELERAIETTNDSIAYARRIQEAMLPNLKQMRELLPNSFVYFKPRDVVSGDFYWMTEWNDFIVLAAVDCTGHGVPGAFMSVLGQSLLNQIVKEKYNYVPANILHNLDLSLTEVLQQDEASDVYDGMEAAVVTINMEDKTIQYAGATIPLYIVNKDELTTIPATHYALGGARRGIQKEFQNHTIPLKAGDTVYLFSDGFRDQFGLENGGAKFKYSTRRFQQLLRSIYHETMDRQREILSQEFDVWRGRLRQLDDVMVIGIRF